MALSQTKQQDVFALELEILINRFRDEFDLTLSSAVGVLEIAKAQLIDEALTEEDGE